jgi:hypothetical protein
MEHIINLAFELDDDSIRKTAENSVQKEAEKIIKEIFLDQIAPYGSTCFRYSGCTRERDWSAFDERIEKVAMEFFEGKKDEIINLAAEKLVDSLRRTKAWKEKYGDVL